MEVEEVGQKETAQKELKQIETDSIKARNVLRSIDCVRHSADKNLLIIESSKIGRLYHAL